MPEGRRAECKDKEEGVEGGERLEKKSMKVTMNRTKDTHPRSNTAPLKRPAELAVPYGTAGFY